MKKIMALIFLVFSCMMLYSCPSFDTRSDQIVPIVTDNHHPLYGEWEVEYTDPFPIIDGPNNGEVFYINAAEGSFYLSNTYQEDLGASGKIYFTFLSSDDSGVFYEYSSYSNTYMPLEGGFVRIRKQDDYLYIQRAESVEELSSSTNLTQDVLFAHKLPVKL